VWRQLDPFTLRNYHEDGGAKTRFLPAIGRWLAPGSRLIFRESNLMNPYIFLIFKIPLLRRFARLEPDEMAFTPGFIRNRLKRAGFSDVRARTREFLLPNTPEALIPAVITVGSILERLPGFKLLAQSVFVTAV
jgi:hypothetical protein